MLVMDGVTMPTPKANGGYVVSRNKVWSANTGRASDGGTVGDLVGIKYKLELQWAVLTPSQIATLDSIVSKPFFSVTFTDPVGNKNVTRTFYAGDSKYPVYSWSNGKFLCNGVGVNLIER